MAQLSLFKASSSSALIASGVATTAFAFADFTGPHYLSVAIV
jgi:hypothetical protein